jgi:hypothetical protein
MRPIHAWMGLLMSVTISTTTEVKTQIERTMRLKNALLSRALSSS